MTHNHFDLFCNILLMRNLKGNIRHNREYGRLTHFGVTQKSLASPIYTPILIVLEILEMKRNNLINMRLLFTFSIGVKDCGHLF